MFKKTKELILNTWKNANQSATVHQVKNPEIDIKVILILIYTAVGLTVVKYFGSPACFLSAITQNSSDFQKGFYTYFFSSTMGNFHRLLWWISTIVIIYLVIPIGIIRLGFKEKVREYGFCFANVKNDYPLYLTMLIIMIPIVFIASSTKGFQAIYPIFKPEKNHLFPLFFLWQMAYLVQFIAVEFFFRGFMIHGIKNRFGAYAVFVSTIPYCMIHFGKTFEETIAAIIAGIILGTLSLKSRSIFLGVIIHYSVAITMDLFSLWRKGFFS
ncbi:CPBP family intramembrane glutamic endopeptidase [Flavobacterium sp.]|uniref:CPBP family intramembrane glutamic endopeptidase n=1 Tax=Flavobacterium sp. TaxID=239 RepID=UPI00286D1EFE|nr:CPBP family intramembrane glutamic endopeptidase [Flavobacterium sp.]